MINQEIDNLTRIFYESICFHPEHFPKFDQLQELFYGDGKLLNSNFDKPIDFTLQTYIQAVMHQIEEGNTSFYSQQEIADVTEVFGRIAQRVSVYEYSTTAEGTVPWKRGINYIHYIFVDGSWKILSMVWQDERKGLKIPEAYLQ